MSGPPRPRSMNQAEPELRPVLGPEGINRSGSGLEPPRKPLNKQKGGTLNNMQEADEKKSPPATVAPEEDSSPSPSPKKKVGSAAGATIPKQQQMRGEVNLSLMRPNLSMNASARRTLPRIPSTAEHRRGERWLVAGA